MYKWIRNGIIPVPDVAIRLGAEGQKNKRVRFKIEPFKQWLDAGGEFVEQAAKGGKS
ncbi:MAG: hypothetical protein ACRETN_07605 [Nevskiales bacterium]